MALIDRHIVRRLLSAYAFFVAALVVFFVVLHLVEYVDDFFDGGAKMGEVLRVYYPAYVPEIVRLTSPLAFFLACVYLTGRLAQSFQVMALQAAGVSLGRLIVPFLGVAVALTGALFYVGGYVVPRTQATILDYDGRYLNERGDETEEVSDIHRQNAPGSFLAVGYFDREAGTAFRVSLVRYAGQAMVERIEASTMTWQDSLARWRFEAPLVRRTRPDGSEARTQLTTLDTALNVLPRDLARTERDAEAMTIPEARAYIDSIERTGSGSIGAPRVAYAGKFSYPVAHLVLALIAVPLAVRRRRGGQTARFIAGLFIAFLYLATQRLVEPFGANLRIDPLVASWAPHALFFGFGVIMLWEARRQRG